MGALVNRHQLTMDSWRILAGSATGSTHLAQGRGCDDAYGWSVHNDLTVLAVADGAGSRPGTSAYGAFIAVQSVLAWADAQGSGRVAANDTDEPRLKCAFQAALATLLSEADRLGLRPGLLATTLSVALIGPQTVEFGQVGDGIAVLGSDDGSVRAVAKSDRFEYANETVFLTSHDALEAHLQCEVVDLNEIESIALSTDGLRFKVLDDLQSGKPYAPFFVSAWEYAHTEGASGKQISEFLANVDDDQSGDDKTLVLAVRSLVPDDGAAYGMSSKPVIISPDGMRIYEREAAEALPAPDGWSSR